MTKKGIYVMNTFIIKEHKAAPILCATNAIKFSKTLVKKPCSATSVIIRISCSSSDRNLFSEAKAHFDFSGINVIFSLVQNL